MDSEGGAGFKGVSRCCDVQTATLNGDPGGLEPSQNPGGLTVRRGPGLTAPDELTVSQGRGPGYLAVGRRRDEAERRLPAEIRMTNCGGIAQRWSIWATSFQSGG